MGEDYFRMPWANLKYDTNPGGYRLALLRTSSRAPRRFNRNTDWDWSNLARDKEIYDCYRTPL
jgi:hypothetical protein